MFRLHVHQYLRGTRNKYAMVPNVLPHQWHEIPRHAESVAEQIADPREFPVVECGAHELLEVHHVLRYLALEGKEYLGVVDLLLHQDFVAQADFGLELASRVDDVRKHLEEFPLVGWLKRRDLASQMILKEAADVLIRSGSEDDRVCLDPVGLPFIVCDADRLYAGRVPAKSHLCESGEHRDLFVGLNLFGEELGEVWSSHPAGEKHLELSAESGPITGDAAPHLVIVEEVRRHPEVQVCGFVIRRNLVVAD